MKILIKREAEAKQTILTFREFSRNIIHVLYLPFIL